MNERDAEVISVYAWHCLVKCANVVLSSRVFSSNRIPPDERAKKWFSLAVEEVEPAVKELAQWRSDPRQPLAIEIFLRSNSSDKDDAVQPDDVLLERWLLGYDASASADSLSGSASLDRSDEVRMDKHSVYKKMVILTRSLYSYLRILPAYRLYRAGQNAELRTYDLIYRLSSGEIPGLPIDDSGVQFNHFSFSDLETPSGSLSIQVHYRPSSTIGVLEETTQTQALPRIISDYINTPRHLQSLSVSVHKTPAVASAGLSPSGTHGAQPLMLHRNSWSSKDVPNLLPLPTPYSATSSQIAASPKPSTLNGQRHIPGRNPIRTTSAPVSSEKRSPSDRYTTKSRSFGEREWSRNYRYIPQSPEGRCNLVKEEPGTSSADDQGRKVSAPVTIPCQRAHRGGSFPDLSAAATVVAVDEGFQILESSCVASAPANVPLFNGIPRSPRVPRNTPPIPLAVSCSDSSFSSAFPQSCSPQLPFAFTPSGPSSSGDQAGFGSGPSNLSPPISGRDISALAVIRRPSWSSRSFDMNNPRFSDPSEPWLSQCSQPMAGFCIPVSGPPESLVRLSPSSRLLQSGGSDAKSGSILHQSDVFHSCVDSSESDLLPFALDGEGPSGAEGSGEGGSGINAGGGASTTEGSSSQSDAAVVSFLRLMQEAPPLTSPGTSPSMSVERAKEQLREFKVKVEGFKLGKSLPTD